MDAPTRRHVLGSIAAASALAGCATSSTTSTQFNQVTTEGTSLVIELDSAESVDELSVINPDGAGFRTVEATAGQTRYTIDIGTEYTPGEYEINTVVDGEVAATTTTSLRPNVEITDVGIGENHPEQMPDSLGETKGVECFVDLRNTGSGSTAIQRLSFDGDVPNPTDGESSGIFDAESGGGEANEVVINSKEQETVFSSTLPFSFEGTGVDCEADSQSGEATVRLEFSNVSDNTVTYGVSYTGADSYDGCAPKIEGRK
jgi:hypothetical protein